MGLFDDLIPSEKPDLGAFADLVPKPRNFAAVANDTAIELANAAAGAVSAGANFISPGNRVSQYIDKNIVEAGEAAQSDVAKAAKRKFRGEVEAADGLTGELAAVGRYIVDAPLLTAAQAAGSFALPGLAVKGGGIIARAAGAAPGTVANAGLAGGATAGAALAGGDAAGQAYQLARDAGATEEQAVAAGRQASVLPAIVGGAGGLVGAERLLAGASGVKGGMLARGLKTGAIEATQEGFEEGLTQFEGQRAAMPYDPSIDPWKGVGAAAGMGAAMGGGVGAVTGAATKPHEKDEKPITEGVDKIVGAESVDEAIAAAAQVVSGKPAEPTPAERIATIKAAVDMPSLRAQYGDPAATEFLTSLVQAQNPRVPSAVREQHLRALEATVAEMRETPAAIPAGEAAEMLPTGDVSEEAPVLPTGEATELDAETIEAAAPPPANWQVATRDTATLRDRLDAYRKKPDATSEPQTQTPPPVAERPGAGRAPDMERGVESVPGMEATPLGGDSAARPVADSGSVVPAGSAIAESGEALSVDPLSLGKEELNRRIADVVAAGDAPDSIRGLQVLRRRFVESTGKSSIPPAGSRLLPMHPAAPTKESAKELSQAPQSTTPVKGESPANVNQSQTIVPELGTDLPTLKRQWQDAVRAGDGDLAKRVNAQIVAVKSGEVKPQEVAPAAEPPVAAGGFDPEAFDRERNERIKASRDAGNVHLDKVPVYVETMRGKTIGYAHDPKVRGRILTVDNNGNVYVEWLDAYSQEKEGAVPMVYGSKKKTVMQTSLGPSDLKDYYLTTEPAPATRLQEQVNALRKKPAESAPAPASWVIREKATGDVVMETFDKAKVAALNTAKYEAVPVQEYLASLNRKPAEPVAKPYAGMTADEKVAFDARTGDSPAKRAETAAKLEAIAKATESNRREAPNTTKPGKAESATSQRVSVLNKLLECVSS